MFEHLNYICVGNAVEGTYSHAVFPQGPDAPENKVRFPEIEGDISFRILCDADVARGPANTFGPGQRQQ